MLFLPTDDLNEIITFNINKRMKHISKFYSWLEINKNTPIETKLMVPDNCALNALIYGCEVWDDLSSISSKLITTEYSLLRKGQPTILFITNLEESNLIAKIMD